MSSVDAYKSTNASSDQLFDHICGSCKTDGKDAEARIYCENCAEYLCEPCADFHRKLPSLRNHNVVPASNISGGKPSRRLKDFCACNTNQEVAFYCEDHTKFICSSCQTTKHHKCTISSIQQKSSGYTGSNLDLILAKTKSLKDAYDRLKKECQENESELESTKDTCKKEIQSFRKEIDEVLNKLEQQMLAELDQSVHKERQRIDERINTLSAAIKMLDQEYTSLEKARKDGSKESMFIAETRVSTNLRNYQSRLNDIGKNKANFRLTFERNAALDDLQKCVDAFGVIKVSEKKDQSGQKMVFLGRQIQATKKVNVRLAEDEQAPNIIGCVFMPNDYLVACGFGNCTISLFDSFLSLQDSLKLRTSPKSVSVIDDNTVIVTMPFSYQLQYVQVFPRITLGKVIKLDTHCWGVAVRGQEIYVTSLFIGEVRVLDKLGNLKRRLEMKESFATPRGIAISQAGDKIFVSDETNKSVTCMAVDGSLIYQYKDDSLKEPKGLISDEEDNVIVCDNNSCNIHVINANGKKHGILSLSGPNENIFPMSVAYKRSDNTLVVGCYSSDKLLVCQLTNAALYDLQKWLDAFGMMKVSEKKDQSGQKMVLLRRQIQVTRKVNVRLAQDEQAPNITGCVFMPNDCIVACDYNNDTIKLYDSSLSLQDSLKLPTKPNGVSVIDDNTVIITLPYKRQFQYVQVFPRIILDNVIQLDTYCWDVAVFGQEIYVTCTSPSEVRVLDKLGNLKRRLEMRESLATPRGIAISQAGDKIFVSDKTNKSVTCMATDGSLIYQYKDDGLKDPCGLICDEEGNIIVCDYKSCNIHVITTDGKKHGILSLSGPKENIFPMSVAYRRSDDRLVVGCYSSDKLLVCQLKNAALDDLQKCVDAFGKLKVSEKKEQSSQKMVSLGRQIQVTRTVNVGLTQDKQTPNITGCVFMPNGHLVACDYNNDTIKLFDSSLSLRDSLKLPTKPNDVSVIDDKSTIIVTLPYQNQLQYVQVFPRIILDNVIQLDTYCWGVVVFGQEIYVTCTSPREVRVLDKQGNLKRRLEMKDSFAIPRGIAISQAGDRIFVSAGVNKSVTCMAIDGSLIYLYKDGSLTDPCGLICDEEDNVMVCDISSSNIHMITANGRKHGILPLTGQNKKNLPQSIAYRKSDDTLIVGCSCLDHLLLCQLTN